jgi:hypothetical protein
MGCVIDANVVKGIFQEDVSGTHSLTGSPNELLTRVVAAGMQICLDETQVIEYEWNAVVDPDWFDHWFLSLASRANVAYVEPADCRRTIGRLRSDFGFPRGRDALVVAVAVTSAARDGGSFLLTEDLDFFEPAMKGQKGMRDRLLSGKRVGGVQRYLRKNHDVNVRSVVLFVDV